MVRLPPSLSGQLRPAAEIDDDGKVHVRALDLPLSAFLREEGKAYLAGHLEAVLGVPEIACAKFA